MAKWSDAASAGAVAEIRRFSVRFWLLGAVAAVVVALVQLDRVSFDPATGLDLAVGTSGRDSPWQQEDPPVAQGAGTSWSGRGDALVRVEQPGGRAVPLQVTSRSGVVDVLVSAGGPQADRPVDEREWPRYLDYLSPGSGQAVLIPPAGDVVELWVRAEGAWELSVDELRAQPLESGYDGTGNAVLQYTGDSLSARFSHRGDGVFTVAVHTEHGSETPIIDSGDVDQRISWDPSATVVLEVEATGDGAWTAAVDQLAAATPGPPATGTEKETTP
jgi:hypothetical protein